MPLKEADGSPSSAVIEQDAVVDTAAVDASDANAAESSTADTTDAKAPASLLDVVKDAVEKKADGQEESSASEGDQEAKDETATATETEQAKDGEADDVPFHKHPRWQEMIAERDRLKPAADSYEKISAFMTEHNLVPTEVAEGFEVMALLKAATPESLTKALEWFESRTTYLREATGAALPEDLATRVDDGVLDQDSAAELARMRAQQSINDRRTKQETEQREQRETVERNQAMAAQMGAAVQTWEDGIKGRDPDYSKKAGLIEDRAIALAQRFGLPKTTEEAVALAERAYKDVSDNLKAALPPPRRVTPTPAGSSATTIAQPKTMREAISAAVRG